MKIPFTTWSLTAISSLFLLFDKSCNLMQYDRAQIAQGQLWRIISGHFSHWSFDHFLWSTITFLVLGTVCEQFSRKAFLMTMGLAAFFIPLVSWLAIPEMEFYRGLSGLGSAAFLFAGAKILKKSLQQRDRPLLLLSVLGSSAFVGKILFEYFTGSTLFANSNQLFNVVPLVHLVGGAIGILTAFLFPVKPWSNTFSPTTPTSELLNGSLTIYKNARQPIRQK